VTHRYTEAIEQLGSDNLDVRIGGIYALERIARDSAEDHPTVMEKLTAFIRKRSREQWPPAGPGAEVPEWAARRDVQAAFTVVGRRDAEHDIPGQPIDLTGAVLDRAYLAGAVLPRANLTRAILTRADLTRAYLTGAVLDRADLSGADLGGADLDDAILTDVRWPEGVRVPVGWMVDGDSGRLKRAGGLPEVTVGFDLLSGGLTVLRLPATFSTMVRLAAICLRHRTGPQPR
jgi:hypothetical protein